MQSAKVHKFMREDNHKQNILLIRHAFYKDQRDTGYLRVFFTVVSPSGLICEIHWRNWGIGAFPKSIKG